jgi:hypothetical protein
LFPNMRGDALADVFLDRIEHKFQYKNVLRSDRLVS